MSAEAWAVMETSGMHSQRGQDAALLKERLDGNVGISYDTKSTYCGLRLTLAKKYLSKHAQHTKGVTTQSHSDGSAFKPNRKPNTESHKRQEGRPLHMRDDGPLYVKL